MTRTLPVQDRPVLIEEYTARGVRICVVHGRTSTYVIEPYRFSIGATRVGMVDEHLAQLVRNDAGWHPDLELLADARAAFFLAQRAPTPKRRTP